MMTMSEMRAQERELMKVERIDRTMNAARKILLDNWDDFTPQLRAYWKVVLAKTAEHLGKERASGKMLTRSMSTNGFLALTSEEKQFLAQLSKE